MQTTASPGRNTVLSRVIIRSNGLSGILSLCSQVHERQHSNAKSVIVALFSGFLIGSIYGLVLIIRKRKFKQTIPFGPFISVGSVIALFYGNNILKWYTSFLF